MLGLVIIIIFTTTPSRNRTACFTTGGRDSVTGIIKTCRPKVQTIFMSLTYTTSLLSWILLVPYSTGRHAPLQISLYCTVNMIKFFLKRARLSYGSNPRIPELDSGFRFEALIEGSVHHPQREKLTSLSCPMIHIHTVLVPSAAI